MNSYQSIYFLDDPQNRKILEDILVNGIINDKKDVLEQYLKDGGHPDRRIKDKDTLLETAIDAHKIWAVELLVKYKANINLFRYDGYTPCPERSLVKTFVL